MESGTQPVTRQTYQIFVQPNPGHYLYTPGTIEFDLELTPEQLSGMMMMYYVLHLDPFRFRIHLNWEMPSLVITHSHYIATMQSFDQLREYLEQGHSWLEAIRLQWPTAPPITQRYTADFWSEEIDRGYIVQFNTLEFLQAAISVCQWLSLNWRDHIHDIHEGDTRVEVTNL
jgi:hypothetical protein